jgi:hypothetical protein
MLPDPFGVPVDLPPSAWFPIQAPVGAGPETSTNGLCAPQTVETDAVRRQTLRDALGVQRFSVASPAESKRPFGAKRGAAELKARIKQ